MKIPLKQLAYDAVVQRIAAGEFRPGMRLPEVALAKEFGVSPTPLREAFRQLVSEGLLEHRNHSGVFVRELDVDEIRDLYELREAIESFCAAKATQWMNKVQTDTLQHFVDQMQSVYGRLTRRHDESLDGDPLVEFVNADEGFHALIIEASNNSALVKVARESHAVSRLMAASMYRHTPEQVGMAIEQHAAILDAIRRHDPEEAERWIKRHLEFSRDSILERMEETADSMPTVISTALAPFSSVAVS